ncbi:hypothetical protein PAAG_12520 [Paracoccidioides lutzii Pb01]|uniref:Uncharacterized protein n=1 Tax=Paracoccidioides lutzii (strain ATCC MYA-826 / Pb01) TaxID=502779 RepID=A0A0A2V344_PARBA|nr:hypothetical protein PAAG_12520 [Paracoccidioides lutzii Pb01]KGQ00792.1 hypothetical protein PAAG_12520 [Paracoccidioides lutzii Pb01]
MAAAQSAAGGPPSGYPGGPRPAGGPTQGAYAMSIGQKWERSEMGPLTDMNACFLWMLVLTEYRHGSLAKPSNIRHIQVRKHKVHPQR